MSNMENNNMENEQTHAPLSYDERVQLLQEGKMGDAMEMQLIDDEDYGIWND